MTWLTALQLLPTIKNLLAPKTTAPVVIEEKTDYTIYWIIGGFTVIILVILLLIINNKNK